METYFLTKDNRNNFKYIPEYSTDGIPYTWNDLMDIAKGNEKVAYFLYCECSDNDAWAYPETYLYDSILCDEIVEDSQGNYSIRPEYDFNLVLNE